MATLPKEFIREGEQHYFKAMPEEVSNGKIKQFIKSRSCAICGSIFETEKCIRFINQETKR